MSQKIVFNSAVLLGFTRTLKKATASFSCSLTKSVISSMGWTDVHECATGASLDGDLSATILELVPKDKEMERQSINVAISQIYKFELIRLELEGTKQGKGHRQELRFTVALNDSKACRVLEQYMLTIGDGKGSATVHYEPQPVQVPLPGAAADSQEPLPGV